MSIEGLHQSMPCPYCGNVGYHVWAGTGGCPGAASERERDIAAASVIRTLIEENRRLQFAVGKHVTLSARAADALETSAKTRNILLQELIHELREASE